MQTARSAGVAAIIAALATAAHAATIHVPADQPSIAAGLAVAQPGDEVVIACGFYYGFDVALREGVTVRSETGDPSCVTVSGDHLATVFIAGGLETPAVLEGLTITNGIGSIGGGLRIDGSNVVMRRCVVTGNLAADRGGGLFAAASYLRCEDCVFVGNEQYPPRGGGGGLYLFWQATADLINCTVADNEPNGAVVLFGAGHAIRCILEESSGWTTSCCWTGDPLFCGPPADLHLSLLSPCLPGVTCTGLIGALGLGCGGTPEERTYGVTTDPVSLPVIVDGTSSEPGAFTWTQYTEHFLEAPASVTAAPGSRWAFRNWNDGEDRAHRMWATRDPHTWTANFDFQHYLTATATSGGSVPDLTGWRAAGAQVSVTATPDFGYVFYQWLGTGDGSYSGSANPAVVTMDGPVSQTAYFAPNAYEFSVSASDLDPHVNASVPAGGPRWLYLWLACSRGGLAAFEADVPSTLPIAAFEPLNGVLNAGSATHLLMAVPGCPSGTEVEMVLGRWLVVDEAPGGELCLGGGHDIGEMTTLCAVDCGLQPFCAQFPGVTGFSSSAAVPCRREGQSCWSGEHPGSPTDAVALPSRNLITALLPSLPNPFSGGTTVRFTLATPGRAALHIYDVGGRLVRSLVSEELSAGQHERRWDGRDAADRFVTNGVYFLRLESGGETATQKVLRIAR